VELRVKRRAAILLVCLLSAAAAASTPRDAARVETADARAVEGRVLAISADAVTVQDAKGDKQSLPLANVTEIVFAAGEDAMARPGQAVLVTDLGETLAAGDLSLAKGKAQFSCPLLGRAEVRVESLRAVYLPAAGQTAADVEARYRRMKLAEAPKDRLLVTRPSAEPLAVDGALVGIDADSVTFQWEGQTRQVPRKTVPLICLAATSGDRKAPPKCLLVGRDGSAVHCTSLTLAGRTISLQAPSVGRCDLPVARAAAVRFASANMVSLVGIEPSAVKEHGFFDTTFHYRKGKAVSGKPLQLGGRTYSAGLGLHSFCELTWALNGEYSLFVATVGIDDAVRPNGDATVIFLGDGKPLGEPVRLRGKDNPQQDVRLKIAGVKSFAVRVDFGFDRLDFADHVDLVNPRLLK